MLLEEKIEYNDLVDSILDGNGHGDDKPNNKEAVENKDDGPKIGNLYYLFIVFKFDHFPGSCLSLGAFNHSFLLSSYGFFHSIIDH